MKDPTHFIQTTIGRLYACVKSFVVIISNIDATPSIQVRAVSVSDTRGGGYAV